MCQAFHVFVAQPVSHSVPADKPRVTARKRADDKLLVIIVFLGCLVHFSSCPFPDKNQ
jgi:hypothetical protein